MNSRRQVASTVSTNARVLGWLITSPRACSRRPRSSRARAVAAGGAGGSVWSLERLRDLDDRPQRAHTEVPHIFFRESALLGGLRDLRDLSIPGPAPRSRTFSSLNQ